MMRKLSTIAGVLAVLGLSACSDQPNGPSRGAPRGAIALPTGAHAALIELRSSATIDGASIGYGDERVLLPPSGAAPYRIVIISDKNLEPQLPVRVDLAEGSNASVDAILIETADAEGTVTSHDTKFVIH